jgi:hypothetical protein
LGGWKWNHIRASVSTVKRRLREVALNGRISRSMPLLPDQHKQQQLQWAMSRMYWTVDIWKKVVWSG